MTTFKKLPCGVCGKDEIDAITATTPYAVAADPVRLAGSVLAGSPAIFRLKLHHLSICLFCRGYCIKKKDRIP